MDQKDSPEEGTGNLLHGSCMRNPLDKGAWRVTVHGGHERVGHDLVTKQQQKHNIYKIIHYRKTCRCCQLYTINRNIFYTGEKTSAALVSCYEGKDMLL